MNRCLAPLLLVVLLSSPVCGEPIQVRVLSYNIHHGEGVDGKLDLPRIAKVILSVQPDIVALQEVDRNTARTGKVDQPAELAKLTKMHSVFGGNIPLGGGEYGNAILSRGKVLRHKNHLLPSLNGGEQRGVLEAELQLPESETSVVLFATHFDHRSDDAERLESAALINKLAKNSVHFNKLAKKIPLPALLVGDLNASPQSAPLKVLAAEWKNTAEKPLPTFPVEIPKTQIDFVLFRPAARWKVVEVRVLDEKIASDHRPLFTVLELVDETN